MLSAETSIIQEICRSVSDGDEVLEILSAVET